MDISTRRGRITDDDAGAFCPRFHEDQSSRPVAGMRQELLLSGSAGKRFSMCSARCSLDAHSSRGSLALLVDAEMRGVRCVCIYVCM